MLIKIISELKKKLPHILLSTCIVIFFWWFLLDHYKNFSHQNDLITKLEANLLDFRFRNRGPQKPKNKIGVLAIDEAALQELGRWPFSRRYYKQALKNLKDLGVEWVAFDAIFSEPERPDLKDGIKALRQKPPKSPRDAIRRLKSIKTSPADLEFAKAISDFENIIMGFFYFGSEFEVEDAGLKKTPFHRLDEMDDSVIEYLILSNDQELKDYPDSMKVAGIMNNLSVLNQSAQHYSFFSNQSDYDAVNRWATIVRIFDDRMLPSLSLKLAAEALDRDILVEMGVDNIKAVELISREDESDSIKIPLDPLGMGRVLVNHRGGRQAFPHFSLADAYFNRFTKKQKEYLKGSVLMLGMTAIGINDQRPNPFDPTLDGVEIHAAVTDNIMSQNFMTRPSDIYETELQIILAIGLFFSPIIIFSRALWSGILMLLFLFSYYFYDQYFVFGQGQWTYLGVPFLEIITLFISITLYKYMTEEKEKKKVKGAFAHYLSPDVIDQVLDDPSSLQLGGVRKELTVFFSDVRGFTTISESLTPEQLCGFMNEYFTPMTDIILRSSGVLDKYIGDAIMAFWGAPVPLDGQADVAADSSVKMLFALDKLQADFKEKGYPLCDIGIGLNTGPMSVGNMGSDERFCYTVMGDAVNLGARLEGLTKEYGIKILISEFTVAKFQQKHHLFRDLDDIRVKGKNEPIKVFDLMRPDTLAKEDHIRELIGEFEAARKHYLSQDWVTAKKHLDTCLKIHPNDGPTKVYIDRVNAYQQAPPAEDWDGVFTFTHK
ncbi:MAG: CHASE2 domain-containing protein [Oligoflexales bacterium]